MAVTDLTGTSWIINSVTCSAGYGQFNVNHFIGIYEGSYLFIGYEFGGRPPQPVESANEILSMPSITFLGLYDTLSIIGGTDATNSTLISWLQENATQIQTGYSITYHANGGAPEPENLTGQTNLPSPLPTVSKANFTFDGWYTDSTFTTPAVAGAEISADTDLYAKFTRTHITLDLSTIGLPEGTHSIQMKLSGGDKRDSVLSNSVTYTVSTWEYPVEDGDNLIITQANTITEDGDYLIIE